MTRAQVDTADAEWDRLFEGDRLELPHGIELKDIPEGPGIAWDGFHRQSGAGPEWVDPKGILIQFTDLADGDANACLKFAQRYGPLYLCEHRLPKSHDPIPPVPPYCELLIPEPVTLWVDYAIQVRALIRIAASLHRSEAPEAESWEDANVFRSEGSYRKLVRDLLLKQDGAKPSGDGELLVDQHDLGCSVDKFMHLCGTSIGFHWHFPWERERSGPQILVTGDSPLGFVARDLAFAVGKADGLVVCSGCGRGFIPNRRPRAGESTWCPSCRGPKAKAARMRRYRKKKRGG